jgi:YhcH/YjgK/YiaL family protein
MIYDRLDNLARYENIPQLDAVLEYLGRTDVYSLPAGDIPIRGDDLYVKVLRYQPKPAAENFFETHKRYTDVQLVFRGAEQMQVTAGANLSVHNEYDVPQDYQFFTATEDISSIVVNEGEFIVFSPGEAHMPGCLCREPDAQVLKLVFKIRT